MKFTHLHARDITHQNDYNDEVGDNIEIGKTLRKKNDNRADENLFDSCLTDEGSLMSIFMFFAVFSLVSIVFLGSHFQCEYAWWFFLTFFSSTIFVVWLARDIVILGSNSWLTCLLGRRKLLLFCYYLFARFCSHRTSCCSGLSISSPVHAHTVRQPLPPNSLSLFLFLHLLLWKLFPSAAHSLSLVCFFSFRNVCVFFSVVVFCCCFFVAAIFSLYFDIVFVSFSSIVNVFFEWRRSFKYKVHTHPVSNEWNSLNYSIMRIWIYKY